MKKTVAWILMLVVLLNVSVLAAADTQKKTEDPLEYYTIGAEEDTFQGLYQKMCVYLDLAKHPIPQPDTDGDEYGTGDYERYRVLKDDEETYEYIGYVYSSTGSPKYLVRNWIGYHKDGPIISMKVYYSTDGKYIGNLQMDLTNGLSNSSHNMPYYIPSQGMHRLK